MRIPAYHIPLSLLTSAVPEEERVFRLRDGRIAKRAHIWGVVVSKLVGDNYVRFILDDFTATSPVIFFDPRPEVEKVEVGDTVDVVGRLRAGNDDVGLVGDTLKRAGPELELLRRLENVASALRECDAPPPVKRQEEEELEVETLDLEGGEW